jgi:hypothetical protein
MTPVMEAQTVQLLAGLTAVFLKPEVLGTSLSGGGVIPSAAGGMTVNDGKGGIVAVLHPNEMVLPADLSQGVQAAIRRPGGWSIPGAPSPFQLSPSFAGGAAGGQGAGGDTYQVNISTLDSRSVDQWAKANSAALAKAVMITAKRNFVGGTR